MFIAYTGVHPREKYVTKVIIFLQNIKQIFVITFKKATAVGY